MDLIKLHASIGACEKGQQWNTAFLLAQGDVEVKHEGQCDLIPRHHQRMCEWAMDTDVITYNATISTCKKGEKWIIAVGLLRCCSRHRNRTRTRIRSHRMPPSVLARRAIVHRIFKRAARHAEVDHGDGCNHIQRHHHGLSHILCVCY